MSGPNDQGASPHGSELAALERNEITARQSLLRERREAMKRQGRNTGWLMLFGFGPATLAAIGLALLSGRPDLIWPFVGLGAGVQVYRMWKEQRRLRAIQRELADPIDGS
jgi:glycine cleavage system aminomethyltransferase T